MIDTKTSGQSFGIITFAYGAQEYIDLGIALGQSLARFSPTIARSLVTDSRDERLAEYFDPIIPLRRELGSDVTQKLYIDAYSPFDKSLFIDCDSLVFADLKFAFELFEHSDACAIGTEFFVPGDKIREADIAAVTKSLRVQRIPRFNGGVYYIDKHGAGAIVIARARELLADYQKLGFKEFRQDGPADELLMGAAMAETGYLPISDDGRLMRTPIGLVGKLNVDVIKGKAAFNKNGALCFPAIVHFAGEWRKHHVYFREMAKLHILSSKRRFAELHARIYGVTFDLSHNVQRFGAKLWSRTPRPLRLFMHGVRNRLSAFL